MAASRHDSPTTPSHLLTGTPGPAATGPRRTPVLRTWVRAGAGSVAVEISGDLDRWSVEQFTAAVASALSLSEHADELVIDLAGVDFVDLGGARAVTEAIRAGARTGIPVTLTNPPRHLGMLFEILAEHPDAERNPESPRRR